MKNELPWLRPFLIGALLPAIIIALSLAWLAWGTWAPQIASWSTGASSKDFNVGVWGDSYGAYNALVGSLGFAAVAFTLILQMRALKQQQDDLHRQRFESSFFELLKILRECRSQYVYTAIRSPGTHEGIQAFETAIRELRTSVLMTKDINGKHPLFAELYEIQIHSLTEITVSPYFRVIYRLLDRIREDAILSQKEKQNYAKLLRGQFNSSEIYFMALNGLLLVSDDFSNLITKYRMLKYMPGGPIRAEMEKRYPPEAFKGHGD